MEAVMRKMADASEKPYMDSEPRYEDHPACFDASIGYFWDAADVRQNAYWSVLAAAKGKDYAYIYSPLGIPFTVDSAVFADAKCIKASWFNPRTGEERMFGVLQAGEKSAIAPPSCGKGEDWVLVLEAVAV